MATILHPGKRTTPIINLNNKLENIINMEEIIGRKNYSLEDLAKRFAPDDEFLVNIYASKNDVYILWESGEVVNGELYVHIGYFDVVKLNTTGNSMDIVLYYYVKNPNASQDNEKWPYPSVSYKEILNDSQYATLPDNINLGTQNTLTILVTNK